MNEFENKTVFQPNSFSLKESNKIVNLNCEHVLKIRYAGITNTFKFKENKKFTIGRINTNFIYVESPIVSKTHLDVRISGDKCYIKDLNSKNGTFVNGQKIMPGVDVELKNGMNISIDSENQSKQDGVLIEYFITLDRANTIEKFFNINGKNQVSIGRDSACDIQLDHSQVSRLHVLLTNESGQWMIEDKSTNGTILNGVKLSPKTKVVLKNNDGIQVLNAKFTFRLDGINYTVVSNGFSLDAIDICKVVKDGGKEKTLVDHVNLAIGAGEFVAIVGGSGAGKSTLLDCLNGFRPATGGKVVINGDDFYANYSMYKEIIGYVPQKDIVYESLTLKNMLYYSAKLRMPKDSSDKEIDLRIKKVIKDVCLDGKENVLIKKLSGGQKKRASIAIELLAEPQILFLDEPSSGLDPGMEKSLMKLLQRLAKEGTTIILITHATTNINLCDKIVFLGTGGKLCYYGSPKKMLEFFGLVEKDENGKIIKTGDPADIYMMLSVIEADGVKTEKELQEELVKKAEQFRNKLIVDDDYKMIYKKVEETKNLEFKKRSTSKKKGDGFRQFRILTQRYFKLISSDIMSLCIMIGQAPLMVLILKLVGKENAFDKYQSSKEMLFTISCMAALMGILNAFLEVCKEREIVKREASSNVGIIPYIMSKLFTLSIICIFQGGILVFGSKMVMNIPNRSLVFNNSADYWIIVSLVLIAASSMGLLISSYAINTERATLLMPVAIIPQLVFSGVLFELSGVTKIFSNIIVSKWAMDSLGALFNINAFLPPNSPFIKKSYEFETHNLIFIWFALISFIVICTVLSTMILRKNIKQE